MMFAACYFAQCDDPPTVEALWTYDDAAGTPETIPLALCRRHADAVRDEVVVLETR